MKTFELIRSWIMIFIFMIYPLFSMKSLFRRKKWLSVLIILLILISLYFTITGYFPLEMLLLPNIFLFLLHLHVSKTRIFIKITTFIHFILAIMLLSPFYNDLKYTSYSYEIKFAIIVSLLGFSINILAAFSLLFDRLWGYFISLGFLLLYGIVSIVDIGFIVIKGNIEIVALMPSALKILFASFMFWNIYKNLRIIKDTKACLKLTEPQKTE